MEDTIAAISTSQGVGAIAIIRVSGNDALNIVNKISKSKKVSLMNSHTIKYDFIVDKDKVIDEVLITYMKGPKSFTCEDIIEINTHGGITTTNYVLKLLLKNGCRLAEPGEFTKRAFLNGRIDLSQAEAITDLINSKTEKSRKLAINQLNGNVSNLIRNLREELVKIISNIEVNIDYPEYEDIEVLTNEKIIPSIDKFETKLEKILLDSKNSVYIKEGINTLIIGKPNVGKSSLLNTLINEDKAIVTDIEGTTRDIVEGKIVINGIILNIIDTAGIRKTDNIVEDIGVKKSLSLINEADLILFVFNNNDEITKDELEIIKKVKDKNVIAVVNKIDLENKLNIDNKFNHMIKISALNKNGIDELKDEIEKIYKLNNIETDDLTYLNNARSLSILEDCIEKLNIVKNNISNGVPIDIVEIDLKDIWQKLGEIIGETYTEELLDQLFKNFCLGK